MNIEKIIEKGIDFYGLEKKKEVLERLSLYAAELKRWNERMNLTGIKDIKGIVTHLLYDAFFLVPMLRDLHSVMDLGSGAGVLGIPINILCPNLCVYSIDKSLRKIQFQRHIKRSFSLANFTPLHERVESLDSLNVDAIVVKGFSTIDTILDLGGFHIKKGGRAYILKGEGQAPIKHEGYTLEVDRRYTYPERNRVNRLYVYRKD